MPAIETHVDDALARFQQTLKDQPNLAAFLTAVVAPVQDIEDAMQQLLTERSIDTAVGAQLDDIGAIVGQPRNGLADDVYRRYVRARIMTNRSRGIVEDILQVARLVLDDPNVTLTLRTWGYAGFNLTLGAVETADDLAAIVLAFVKDASSAGVRVTLSYSETDPTDCLVWGSSDPGQVWGAEWSGSID